MILVTGASGFLGQHLLQVLAQQPVPVRGLYHSRKPDFGFAHLDWMSCDLLDVFAVEEALRDVTHVYHCAAIVSFDPAKSGRMIQENAAGTANLVNAALEAGIQKLVHVSSVAALGRAAAVNGEPALISEDTHWEERKNNSAYAESKYLAEMEVWRAMAEGLNAVILNPGIILGEGDWSKGSARLVQIVYDEFPWFTRGVNSWVDVKDVAAAMVRLMNSGISEERFIISNGNFSYKEIFTGLARALKRKPPFKEATPWMSEIVWRAEVLKSRLAGKEITISKASARTAQTRYYYDNGKFLRQFPDFQYRDLEDTFERIAAAFRKRH
ncbi:NAD-dependent epimerase/dehydratase family protein [Taibaiella helva]|uniref:NAD-dependent epimerase/dehydratase family protein n=1 Tax=Taibaiella helva TaxID=2301235 RepID=UPI000E5955C5|nr:NAD-dependent epimerase/dehydratase family protein [Taibaiella helva]